MVDCCMLQHPPSAQAGKLLCVVFSTLSTFPFNPPQPTFDCRVINRGVGAGKRRLVEVKGVAGRGGGGANRTRTHYSPCDAIDGSSNSLQRQRRL
eukprot:scaffold4663_cov42-Cyclotella_meneghiniana.AAC.2